MLVVVEEGGEVSEIGGKNLWIMRNGGPGRQWWRLWLKVSTIRGVEQWKLESGGG